jgi:hypothetical protein
VADLDDVVRAIVREALRDELREQLAPLRDAVEALRRHAQPQFVDVRRAAELTGTSVATLRRRVADGSVNVRRLGRRVLVDVDSLRPLEVQ